MNELVVQSEVSERILTIRAKKMMLDRDLTELYGVETKRINEAVRNNKDKFLEDFYFELTDKEFEYLWSKYSTAKFSKTRVNSKVFIEQGVYMLATILKSKTALEVTVSIIRTFAKLREFIRHYNALAKKIMEVERKSDKQYKELTKALDDLINESKVVESKTIGFIKLEMDK